MAPGKTCKHCGQHKPFGEYSSHPNTVDRLQVWCKACVAQAVKEWRANPDNREKERAVRRERAKIRRESRLEGL